MINAPISWSIDEYKDLDSQIFYTEELQKGLGDAHMNKVVASLRRTARDHGRLPMQWSSEKQTGFTTGTPWMRVHDEYATLNVEKQVVDLICTELLQSYAQIEEAAQIFHAWTLPII